MYDLDFWKYKEGVYLDNQKVYEQCSDGEAVEGLELLPITEIKKEIQLEFAGWEMNKAGSSWVEVNGDGFFELYHTEQFVRFDCSYKMKGEDMNRLIDIMLKFDCPLYDPQVPKRYDGK